MKDNVFSSFESPEFKALLKKYEEMVSQHASAYFDSDELTSIAEYYANKEMMADGSSVRTVQNTSNAFVDRFYAARTMLLRRMDHEKCDWMGVMMTPRVLCWSVMGTNT